MTTTFQHTRKQCRGYWGIFDGIDPSGIHYGHVPIEGGHDLLFRGDSEKRLWINFKYTLDRFLKSWRDTYHQAPPAPLDPDDLPEGNIIEDLCE